MAPAEDQARGFVMMGQQTSKININYSIHLVLSSFIILIASKEEDLFVNTGLEYGSMQLI